MIDTLLGLTALLILFLLALLLFATAVFAVSMVVGLFVVVAKALWDTFMDYVVS